MMSRLLAVVVGCNYEGADRPNLPPLGAAEDDARHFSAFLASTPFLNGELVKLQLLLAREATTSNIFQALQQASVAQSPDDTLLFYFSGHGTRSKDGLVLYSWDSEFPARQMVDELNGNRGPVRIVLDCCHAGAIGTETPPASEPRETDSSR